MNNLFTPPKFIDLDFDEIDLSGPDGNAYALMGIFKNQAKREGWSGYDINIVIAECMTSDYNRLCETLKTHCQ